MSNGREIAFIEMFAGIGGFRLGLEQSNIKNNDSTYESKHQKEDSESRFGLDFGRNKGQTSYRCVWANEKDKYATAIYRKNFGEKELIEADIRTIKTEDIPYADLLVGGFPCQTFSVAGKRKGFKDTRGTLFFEIARIAEAKRPKILLLENVKGLLSAQQGYCFFRILEVLDELGYDCEWQVLNSKYFGVPQNRERVFIVGHLRGECSEKIFPITEDGEQVNEVGAVARTLQGGGHSGGLHSNMTGVISKSVRSGGRSSLDRHSWDLIQMGELYEGSQLRVYNPQGVAPTLHKSGGNTEPLIAEPFIQNLPHGFNKGWKKPHPNLRASATEYNELLVNKSRIRRLTPTECERLQGFPDGWTEGVSDTQRYKCLGNAVTVNVIHFLGERIRMCFGGKER